jgi:ribonuclease P/MRP protein subunit RPP40
VDAVLNLYSFVTSCFESGDMALVSFLDLSKAFDCVSHSILAKKLPSYNLHPNSCKMLKSYLADRSQVVKFKNKTSNCLPINQGVPQGSILGPLLFIIFINDLPLSLKSSIGLYADDTIVKNKVTYESIPIIHESALNEALEWFQANKLCLNVHKTQNMLFSLRKTETPENFQTSANFLGLHIDPKLCWSIHGDSVAEKVCKNIFLLRNLKNQLSPEYLRSIYFGICESHLVYGLLVWGHTTIRHRLFGLQRKAIRILAGLGYTDDCKVYFTSLNILTLPSLYIGLFNLC